MRKAIIGTLGALALASPAAFAEVDASFDVGYNTEYIFRGVDLGEDQFTYSLNASGSCNCGVDWNAGIWYSEAEQNGAGPDEELNIYGGISKDLGFGTFELGFTRFIFTDVNSGGNTELYLSYSTELSGIDLSATVYYNADADSASATNTGDLYYDLGAEYSFDISEKLSASVGVGIAFFDNDDESGLANYSGTISASYAASEEITVTPYVSLVLNDSDYIDSLAAGQDDFLFAGVNISYAF